MALEEFAIGEVGQESPIKSDRKRIYWEVGRPLIQLALINVPLIGCYLGLFYLHQYLTFVNPFHAKRGNHPPCSDFSAVLCIVLPILFMLANVGGYAVDIEKKYFEEDKVSNEDGKHRA